MEGQSASPIGAAIIAATSVRLAYEGLPNREGLKPGQ